MPERTCQLTGRPYILEDAEQQAFERFELPLPAVAPEERFRRLASFRPSKNFFLRECSASGAQIFTVYPQQSFFPVFSESIWASADFDATTYGAPFDFKRLFAEQLLSLWRAVPRPALLNGSSSHSRVSHRVWESSGAFLLFDSTASVDCLYSTNLHRCSECIDCYQLENCNRCYETILSEDCRELRFAEFCRGCKDSWFLSQCTDCESCLFCSNLSGKKFHIQNEPVSEEEYRNALAALSLDAGPLLEIAKDRFLDFLTTLPTAHILSSHAPSDKVGYGSGNYHRRCADVIHSFEVFDSERIYNCRDVRRSFDCLDSVSVWNSREVAQSVSIYGGERISNCFDCWDNVSDLTYCSHCSNSSNLLGCIGIRGKEYCIFNKPYEKEKYFELVTEITKHLKQRNIWGATLPANFSPHPYNHSAANEYMPLTKVPAKMMGFAWDESDQAIRPSDLIGEGTTPPETLFSEVPERISDKPLAELTGAVYLCSITGKPFRFRKDEVALYESLGVAPPKQCFQQRHLERVSRLTPHQVISRPCSLSGKELRTAFPPKWRQAVVEAGREHGSTAK